MNENTYKLSATIRRANYFPWHPLQLAHEMFSGDLKGFYSVTVNKNWQIIFMFEDQDAVLVDYLDYHKR